jgi:hypothetical protein
MAPIAVRQPSTITTSRICSILINSYLFMFSAEKPSGNSRHDRGKRQGRTRRFLPPPFQGEY